jgi:DNA-binding NarL/FixJ family response regulator
MVTVSPLLGEMTLAVLLPYLPLEIIGILDTRQDLATALAQAAPDLLLLGLLENEHETIAGSLLLLWPSMKVLALAANGREAWLLETGQPALALPDLSVPGLIGALAARFNPPPPQG